MCGILGVIKAPASLELKVSTVQAMRDTMTDRGPDGAGIFREENVTLGHRRLAIRDATNGQQPWITQCGRYVLVYNGELYNDHEIASELAQAGVVLKTNCDTEVLAEAWALWGSDCISRLRGMFAFGVVDRRTGKVWLVRDRLGIKPLFYSLVGGDLVFASSIAAIRRHPKFQSAPNRRAISHYLQTLRLTFGNETLFQNIYTLLPAEMIEYENQKLSRSPYWQLPSSENNSSIPFDEAAYELEVLLNDAVNSHLKSDVTVGMMLSGGVDSSTLATLTSRQLASSISGVCGGGVGADDRQKAESDFTFARKCADHLGFEYSEAVVTPTDYREAWEELVNDYQSPLSTPSDAIIYRIAQQLKTKCGVALGGEGADEAFCGYEIQHWSGNDFDRIKNADPSTLAGLQGFRQSLCRQYGRDHFGSLAQHYLGANTLIPASAHQALISPTFHRPDTDIAIEDFYQQAFEKQPGTTAAQRYAGVLLTVNLESLLRRLDTTTMAAGLEARVPYADHRLVEYAVRLPHHFKIDVCPQEATPDLSSMELSSRGSLRSKRILRKVASELMPAQLANRPKQSFPTPLTAWLGEDWKSWVSSKFKTSPFAREFFNADALDELSNAPSTLALWKWPVTNLILWGDKCFT